MIRSILSIVTLTVASSAQEVRLYSTDFTTLDGWRVTAGCYGGSYVWAADATPANHPNGPYLSPPASLNFNNGTDIGGFGHVGGAHWTCGWVTSDPIDLSHAIGEPRLRFYASWDMESGCEWDVLSLQIRSKENDVVLHDFGCLNTYWAPPDWVLFDLPLDRAWGEIRIRFGFDTLDDWENWGTGPFIDDLAVVDVLPAFPVTCPGDGSGAGCPCANPGAAGEGCANSTGSGAVLGAVGSPSVASGDLVLQAAQLPPSQLGTYIQGDIALNGGQGVVFGDGLRCAGGFTVRLQQVLCDAGGASSTSIAIAAAGGVAPGDTRIYQLWHRDAFGSPCASNFNLTNGIEVTWVP